MSTYLDRFAVKGTSKTETMEERVGSREERDQESINLKKVCLYATFEVCLHPSGNEPVEKKMITQGEIGKLQKNRKVLKWHRKMALEFNGDVDLG